MAIRGDKLLYVGDKAGAEAYYISGVTKVVDLQGQTVLPGLIEGHMHAQRGARSGQRRVHLLRLPQRPGL